MHGRPRRVLHLIDSGGPGGAETIFLEIVSGLRAHGWEGIPLVPRVDWLARSLRARGFSPAELTTSGSLDLAYLRSIRRIVADEGVDLVQTHLLGTAVYATAACWGRRVPVVSTFHGLPDIQLETGLRRVKFRILGRNRNRLVFVSRSLRSAFQASGAIQGGNLDVIPNGIDCELFSPGPDSSFREELHVPPDALLLGAVGNVRPSKAYDVLLEAFALVRRSVPRARLVIVGQTEGKDELYRRLLEIRRGLGLEETVAFVGFQEDVPRVMRSLDLFVLSSSDEGFSLGTVQAMAVGLPVVATRSGGPEEIVEDGVSGMLSPVDDPEALAKRIVRVLGEPQLARALGNAARRRAVDTFSLERMVESYVELYERCLGTA